REPYREARPEVASLAADGLPHEGERRTGRAARRAASEMLLDLRRPGSGELPSQVVREPRGGGGARRRRRSTPYDFDDALHVLSALLGSMSANSSRRRRWP